MKLFKFIIFFHLLTPMMGYGQDPDLKNAIPHNVLDERLKNISSKLFNLDLENCNLYTTEEINFLADSVFLSTMNLDDTVEFIIVDDYYSGCPKYKDTAIIIPFNKSNITNFAVHIKNNVIIAVAPLRHFESIFSGEKDIKKPLFWVKWEDAKNVLSNSDEKLLTLLLKGQNNEAPKRTHLISKSEEVFYFDSTSYHIEGLITNGIKELYKYQDSISPLLFDDTLFKEPHESDAFEEVKKDALKQYSDADSFVLHGMGVYIMHFFDRFKFKIVHVYREEFIEERYGDILDIIIEQNIYCRQDNFLPLLPEWLKLLMEDIYLE